jgi:hypothetical protein
VVRGLVVDLDPDAIPLCEALGIWKTFAEIERLAVSAKTLIVQRVEEAKTWERAGFRSAAEQLAGIAGSSVHAARKDLETSKKVRKLPKVAAAMRNGKLSAAKAEAIAGAATVAPAAEDALLAGAEKAPLGALLEKCLKAKAIDVDAARERIHRDRCAGIRKDAEGAWNLFARGPVDLGAEFMGVWKPLIDAEFDLAKAEGREEPFGAYAFDALIKLAARAAAPAETETAGSEPATKAKVKQTPAKYLALVRLDYESLVRGEVEGEETCEIVGLGPIPVRIARELLGNAVLKLVMTKGVDVANVTHLGRSVTVAQQVALWWISPDCTREGCTHTERLENDHREDWVKTKHTVLDESDPVCKHDHDLKTYKGWAFVAGKGKRPMVPPDDPRHPNYRAPPDDE